MLEPDSNRFARLMLIVSGIFLAIYFGTALHKWYRLETAPETVSADAVSPFIDMLIIAVVLISYGVFRFIRAYRSSDERDFIREYNKRINKKP